MVTLRIFKLICQTSNKTLNPGIKQQVGRSSYQLPVCTLVIDIQGHLKLALLQIQQFLGILSKRVPSIFISRWARSSRWSRIPRGNGWRWPTRASRGTRTGGELWNFSVRPCWRLKRLNIGLGYWWPQVRVWLGPSSPKIRFGIGI